MIIDTVLSIILGTSYHRVPDGKNSITDSVGFTISIGKLWILFDYSYFST